MTGGELMLLIVLIGFALHLSGGETANEQMDRECREAGIDQNTGVCLAASEEEP